MSSVRPTPNSKLAFFFGQSPAGEPCTPKIIWVEIEGEDDERLVKRAKRDENVVIVYSKLLVQAMDQASHPSPEPGYLPLNHYKCTRKFKLDHDIVLHHRHAHLFDKSLPNTGIFEFTNGTQGILWRCPVTFHSCVGMKLDRLEVRTPNLDATMSDLHVALHFLQTFPGQNVGPEALSLGALCQIKFWKPQLFYSFMKKYAKDAVYTGVSISCPGDVKFLGRVKYAPAEVLPNHPIFHAEDQSLSRFPPILRQTGIPLIARKVCHDPAGRFPRHWVIEDLKNNAALALHLITDVKGLHFNMGVVGNNWHKFLGSVLVVRQDKKPLTPHQVEALVMFCESKASVMADDDNPNNALLDFI
ncbi:hypothetical protein EAF04_010619 [Stromatinia cepivora]|nr:hypothetical protein EAF04_010619 [Stromatinia cepivora]